MCVIVWEESYLAITYSCCLLHWPCVLVADVMERYTAWPHLLRRTASLSSSGSGKDGTVGEASHLVKSRRVERGVPSPQVESAPPVAPQQAAEQDPEPAKRSKRKARGPPRAAAAKAKDGTGSATGAPQAARAPTRRRITRVPAKEITPRTGDE